MAVELQPLLCRRCILPVGDGNSRVRLVQGRGRRLQSYLAALAGQNPLGVAAGQLYAQGAGELIGLVKGQRSAAGAAGARM